MKKNELFISGETIYRILEIKEEHILIIDCLKKTMPVWKKADQLPHKPASEISSAEMEQLAQLENKYQELPLDMHQKKVMRQRYTIIADIVPVIADKGIRAEKIIESAMQSTVSRQTVRKYLCKYLVYQDIRALAPKPNIRKRELTEDEKNFRWALNKFYYNTKKNSLKTAYKLMLKEKYCDEKGILPGSYPSFYQFRYFYRKTYKRQTALISREGLSKYQRDERPCLGDGVREYANHVGIAMMDSTVCDIYLVDDAGNVIGRPVLTACVDGYSSLCYGFSVTLEGGVYSLRDMLLNMVTDKTEYCRKFGIMIEKEQWPSQELPGKIITDMGSEYVSDTFAQIVELGVTLVNLPPYRPDLKSEVEKFFDLVQESYKPYLKGKGVIEEDFQERGGHDYRKDACLTMEDFEKIVIRCTLHYNNKRVIESFPYTEEMLEKKIAPFAASFWKYGTGLGTSNLIPVTKEELILTLLPRTAARFSRTGLKVNKMRYRNENYTEEYLAGKAVVAAYNPEDVSYVWLIEKGSFVRFELIESRFVEKKAEDVHEILKGQRELINSYQEEKLQSEIQLASYIQTIAERKDSSEKSIRNIRENRQREKNKRHKDMVSEVYGS